jgi:NAD(P)-dependent dehydrogenase (short-subunit alcohol dehydrogenase family)
MIRKNALVTGGASGIGRATAIDLARKGVNVIVADVQSDGGMQTVQMVEKLGVKSMYVDCDVSDEKEVENMIDIVGREFGFLNHAFNNAGIEGTAVSVAQLKEADWKKVMDSNLKGVWLCMKYQLRKMESEGGGSIVNVSSIAGLLGFANSSAYVASKHGVIGLTKSAALEFANKGIRINAICPGVIRTPMVDRYLKDHPSEASTLKSKIPMGRFGTPEEIAEVASWLMSDQSSYLTGQAIVADGGWTVL